MQKTSRLMKYYLVCALLLLTGGVGRAQTVLTNYINHPILACGAQHCIILKSDGTVWTSWESGNDASFGQVGQQALSDHKIGPYDPITEFVPDRETNILGATAVAAGSAFSLVLKWDGTVLAFGRNNFGQLGIGTGSNTNKPIPVTGINSAIAISAGSDFAMAVLSDGTVQAWGDNGNGELGNGSTTKSTVPVNVDFPVLGSPNIMMVACGNNHALALTTNGTVWAWGANGSGQSG